MKRAIAVQEILRRVLIVEDNDNLEEALADVRKSYKKERIVLDDSDLISNPITGESVEICYSMIYTNNILVLFRLRGNLQTRG